MIRNSGGELHVLQHLSWRTAIGIGVEFGPQ